MPIQHLQSLTGCLDVSNCLANEFAAEIIWYLPMYRFSEQEFPVMTKDNLLQT